MTIVLAVLWLPVSVHCQLEQIPLLDFLSCCLHEERVPHEDNECATDACAVVESGLYKTEEKRVTLPDPLLEAHALLSTVLLSSPLPEIFPGAPSQEPFELPQPWHFTLRAASAPRAPSLPS